MGRCQNGTTKYKRFPTVIYIHSVINVRYEYGPLKYEFFRGKKVLVYVVKMVFYVNKSGKYMIFELSLVVSHYFIILFCSFLRPYYCKTLLNLERDLVQQFYYKKIFKELIACQNNSQPCIILTIQVPNINTLMSDKLFL